MANTSPQNSTPFMLIFRNAGPESHAHLTPDELRAMTQRWNEWYDRLSAAGKVQHGRPLALGGRVVSGIAGERIVDGPYAEGKEVIGGYLYLTVAGIDEATEIARQCPGLSIGLTVEVRELLDRSPVLQEVRGHAPQA